MATIRSEACCGVVTESGHPRLLNEGSNTAKQRYERTNQANQEDEFINIRLQDDLENTLHKSAERLINPAMIPERTQQNVSPIPYLNMLMDSIVLSIEFR